MPRQIGLFAKHWTPGEVKTRLAQSVGEERAARVAKSFVETASRRMLGAADRHVLGFTPKNSQKFFEALVGAEWLLFEQREGDLGARIDGYFERAWRSGATGAVLLGCDSPDLPLEYVQRAFDLLRSHRLALGPSEDGGYYLIGAAGGTPPVLEGMPWGGPRLWSATIERLAQLGWREGREYAVLPSWYDVDDVEDLHRLRSRLANEPAETALGRLARALAEDLDRP